MVGQPAASHVELRAARVWGQNGPFDGPGNRRARKAAEVVPGTHRGPGALEQVVSWLQSRWALTSSADVDATPTTFGGFDGNVQGNAIPYANATASNLHDITSGSNGTCSAAYLCNGVAGYDGPTGLGTPNGVSAF